jgi:protocatechuate 3,4-dioxygenase beta subunit
MDNDDALVGRVLTRREAVNWLAVAGAGLLVGCERSAQAATVAQRVSATTPAALPGAVRAMPACIVKPEMTVGPYFVDKQLQRSDIRSDPSTSLAKPGAPLDVTFNVSNVTGAKCGPLAGAIIDMWHCDAAGIYSSVQDERFGNTVGQSFLRGYQVTDASGVAKFTTIYPGWYEGRAVHIHFKIRVPSVSGTAYEFTSQLFFDEAVTDRVHASASYAATGRRSTLNSTDFIYGSAGDLMLLTTTMHGDTHAATFDVGLDLANSAVGQPDRDGGPGGGPRPGGPPPGGRRPGGPPPNRPPDNRRQPA